MQHLDYFAIPGWECIGGEKDSGLGQGQLPVPAALWVIFGPRQFSEDNASPLSCSRWEKGQINGNPPVVY